MSFAQLRALELFFKNSFHKIILNLIEYKINLIFKLKEINLYKYYLLFLAPRHCHTLRRARNVYIRLYASPYSEVGVEGMFIKLSGSFSLVC